MSKKSRLGIGVMLVLCALILFLVAHKFSPDHHHSRQYEVHTKIRMGQISNAIQMFVKKCGRLPPEDDWVNAISTANYCGPNEAFTKIRPIDAWGRDFVFSVFSDHLEIKSFGRDGKEGGSEIDQDLILKMKLDGTEIE